MDTIPTPKTEAFLNGMNGTSAGRAVKRWHQFTKDMERELIEAINERDKARTAARKLRDAFAQGEKLPWENSEII